MPTIPYHVDDYMPDFDDDYEGPNWVDVTSQESFNSLCISSENVTQLNLNIYDCQFVSSETMIHLKSLKTLTLTTYDSTLQDDFLLNLPESLVSVEIDLSDSDESPQTLLFNISKFHNLRELDLCNILFVEGAFEGIGNLENLTDLKLMFEASVDVLKNIGSCTKLEDLSLASLECLDDATLIEIIGNNSNLRKLYLSNIPNITHSSVQFIQILPHLERLTVSKCESVTFTFSTEMPSLKCFYYHQCGNTTTQSFAKLLLLAPNLQHFDLTGYSGILELIQVANLIVQERENQSVLRMGVDIPLSQIDSENLSPMLEITQRYNHSGDHEFSNV